MEFFLLGVVTLIIVLGILSRLGKPEELKVIRETADDESFDLESSFFGEISIDGVEEIAIAGAIR